MRLSRGSEGEEVEELAFPADAGGAVDEEGAFVLAVEGLAVDAQSVEAGEVVDGWDEPEVFGEGGVGVGDER